jgi:ATP-dependent 26S proteasome regulatory subunit
MGGNGDAGTAEREQGLMQLLYEMDGFHSNQGVLVVGATNRVALLDDALLRKGRFDILIYMGRPSTSNRFKILQVPPLLSLVCHAHALETHTYESGFLFRPSRAVGQCFS